MEDIFEKMMESGNLRTKGRRAVRRKTRGGDDGEELVTNQLREALGGGSRAGGISPDGAWADLEHAIASSGRRLESEVNEEDGWSGESYDEELVAGEEEEL